MINFDVSRRPIGPQALTDLARAVVAASPEDESDWLEWKGPVDLTSREPVASIARAILGFSNRRPESAARNVGGAGYLVLGAEPGTVHGLQRRDPAELDQALRQLLGSDGPTYDIHWLVVDGRDVLVCSVEAPRDGDPIFTAVRSSGQLRAGAVLIRRPGKTEQADHEEMAMLQARLSASAPANGPDIALLLDGGVVTVAAGDPDDPRWTQFLHDEVAKYPTRRQQGSSFLQVAGEYGYVASDVQRYVEDLRVGMPALAEFAAMKRAPGCEVSVKNRSDKTYSDLRVKLRFSSDEVEAVLVRRQMLYDRNVTWPARPRSMSIGQLVTAFRGGPGILEAPPMRVPEVAVEHPGWEVRLPDTTVHARDTETVITRDDLVIVLRTYVVEVPDEISARWTATSPDVDGRAQGSVVLPRLDPSVDSMGLLLGMVEEFEE